MSNPKNDRVNQSNRDRKQPGPGQQSQQASIPGSQQGDTHKAGASTRGSTPFRDLGGQPDKRRRQGGNDA